LAGYVKDRLSGRTDIDDSLIFITYTTAPADGLEVVRKAVAEFGNFKEVVETTAGCTISCHCGPNTLGVLFVRK